MSAPRPVRIQLGARRERIALVSALLLIVVAGIPLWMLSPPDAARARIQVLAHRGASAYAPENTLAAFRLAIEQRADWLELDVQQTKDGQLVVFHDLRMERTTNGSGALRDLTLEQVRQLDAGSWSAPGFAGERVPTFEEVVALAQRARHPDLPRGQGSAPLSWDRGAGGGGHQRLRVRGPAPSSSRST